MTLNDSATRRRAKVFAVITAGLLLINGLVSIAVLVGAYPAARPAVHIPEANRKTFVNVVVLIDPTRSIRDNDLELAKRIAKDIVASIGYGDVLTICHIGPVFRPENCVQSMNFTEDNSLPSGGEILAILEQHRVKNSVGRQKFYKMLRQFKEVDAEIKKPQLHAVSLVDNIHRPSLGGSDFCGAFNVIEQVFATRLNKVANSTKILFVIGDLIQDQARQCGAGSDQQMSWFSGVKVNLIYPLNSEVDWQRVFSFWSNYFGGVRFTKIPFQAALSGNGYVLPPNPLQGIRKDIPTYRESLSSMTPILRTTGAVSLVLEVLLVLTLIGTMKFSRVRTAQG